MRRVLLQLKLLVLLDCISLLEQNQRESLSRLGSVKSE